MTVQLHRVDAAVVGAGTAGSAAAYQLAARGLSVVLVERRAADAGGAQWHNGVLARQFRRAGIEPPAGAECEPGGGVTRMFGPDGTLAVTLTSPPTVRADMGLLGRRLRTMADEAGVTTIDRSDRLAVDLRGDRIAALDIEAGSEGLRPGRHRIEAALFVDASGRRGILRHASPVLTRWCPTVRGDELCSAADFVLRVTDVDGARRYLAAHGAEPGDTVSVLARRGGFSAQAVSVSPDLERVSVLVGCLANGRYGTGPSLLADLRVEEPWIGDPVSGGFGVIPLRRPYSRFTAPGLALVGDAACQVFPAHGSGIGTGLIAGRILAESVTDPAAVGSDFGGEAALWRYQHAFQQELGGLLASYEAVRRLSTALGTEGVTEMVRSGLMGEATTRAGLDQAWGSPPPAELPRLAANLARRPRLAARVLPRLARSQILGRVGAQHPEIPDVAALVRWDRRVERLLGPLPS